MKTHTTLFLLIALFVSGCVTPTPVTNLSNADIYASPGWQANTVTELAFDLKADGKFDFVWPADVPDTLRQRLELRAIHLQNNWDGE